jgi:murein L,D-transpeptidase YcbB/YkuD
MEVIVGRSYRQTPVFTETMKYLVFNPFWDVPRRLAVEDELPQLKKDPARLARAGFEAALAPGEQMRPVDRIDWQVVSESTPFRLRQRPGAENPLGRIKFMLPNEFAVYLHDTPARGLFDRTERSFSSGCIRVADATALAGWVLEQQHERWPAGRIEEAVDSGQTRTVLLDEPVPVYIVYFTAYVNTQDELVLLRDLYGRDAPVIAALREPQ